MLHQRFSAKSFRYFSSGRFWLAGPATLIISVLAMAATSLWFPEGDARINNLVVPMVLFPLFWACIFFYVLLERELRRLYLIMLLLFLVNGGLVAASIMGWLS